MRLNRVSRFWFTLTAFWCLLVLAGCTTAWTSEAANIINLLVPAITSALGILTAFGVGVTPTVLTAVQTWSEQATTGLQTVAGLIDQYNSAEAAAQPGILTEIQTALGVIVKNLATILPEIHITDPSTQDKVLAVIQAIQAEMQALINVVPALQGKITDHDELKALQAQVKSAKQFKNDFNAKVAEFGEQYKIN